VYNGMAAISSTMASARTFLHDERGHVLMDSPPPFPFPVASTPIESGDTRRRQNIPGEGGMPGRGKGCRERISTRTVPNLAIITGLFRVFGEAGLRWNIRPC
jgi:hypothetical protein